MISYIFTMQGREKFLIFKLFVFLDFLLWLLKYVKRVYSPILF